MRKPADTAFPIHVLLAERWSPRAFSPEPVGEAALGSLFEAARWAPSCYNEQPWSFVVATSEEPEEFARLFACVLPGNAWAARAPVLGLSVARLSFGRNGKPNRHAVHDVGQATLALALQAEALGLATCQLGGFDVERARTELGLPVDHEPVAMFAVGRRGTPETLPVDQVERELGPRGRRPLEEVVRRNHWNGPALFPGERAVR